MYTVVDQVTVDGAGERTGAGGPPRAGGRRIYQTSGSAAPQVSVRAASCAVWRGCEAMPSKEEVEALKKQAGELEAKIDQMMADKVRPCC